MSVFAGFILTSLFLLIYRRLRRKKHHRAHKHPKREPHISPATTSDLILGPTTFPKMAALAKDLNAAVAYARLVRMKPFIEAGWTDAQIAMQLKMSTEDVLRYRLQYFTHS